MARRLTPTVAPQLQAVRIEDASVRLGGHWTLRDTSLRCARGIAGSSPGRTAAGKRRCSSCCAAIFWPTPTGRERRLYLIDREWQDQPLLARERIAYLGPERQDRYDRREFDLRVDEVVDDRLHA